MLGDRLPGERHPAGHELALTSPLSDQEVKDPAARRVGDGRPQLSSACVVIPIGVPRHAGQAVKELVQPPRCSSA